MCVCVWGGGGGGGGSNIIIELHIETGLNYVTDWPTG